MKKLIAVFSVFLLLVILALGYIGVVPGLSPLMAKQKDLGIRSDPKLSQEVESKLGHAVMLAEAEKPYVGEPVYEGQLPLTGSYSSEEVTSVLDSWASNWSITPFYNVQVKFGEDGQAEASGILKVGSAINLAKTLGYSDEDIAKAKSYAALVNGDLPFYVAGIATVSNNQVSATTTSIKLGNVSLPQDIAKAVTGVATDAVERRLEQIPNLMIESMDHQNGQLNLEGTIPSTVRGN